MSLVHLLRNISTRNLLRALDRDGFRLYRHTGSHRMYRHPDGRQVLVSYHGGGQTVPPGTLGNILKGTAWTEEDLRRLTLIN